MSRKDKVRDKQHLSSGGVASVAVYECKQISFVVCQILAHFQSQATEVVNDGSDGSGLEAFDEVIKIRSY